MKHKKIFGKRIVASVLSAALLTVTAAAQLSAQPDLTASAANDNYSKLLQTTLYFYDANMCGTQVSENTALDWRSDCHTADDADGGFHDAGDHAMFGLPQGYAASTLGWSYYEFKDSFDSLGQTAHYKIINDHFCNFFKASTQLDSSGAVSNFLFQKANGDTDHAYWGSPEAQTNDREQYWTSNSASDIAAEYAAALALSYINFGNEEDLKYAEALYAFSTKYNSVATGNCSNFYNSKNCNDDQAWAAGWLYIATNNSSYKSDCASKQGNIEWAMSWDRVELGAAIVNAEITGNWSPVTSYLNSKCSGSNYLLIDSWGSARYNTAMQLCALVATKHSAGDYASWCQGQMDYILGNNPKNMCFVIGFSDNCPQNPHHRGASGLTGWDAYNNSGGLNAADGPTLLGALVGGPTDANCSYSDSMTDFHGNEVAVDYNAGIVGAAAGLYSIYKTGTLATSLEGATKIYSASSTPTTDPTTEPTSEPSVEPTTTATTEATEPPTTGSTTEEDANVSQMDGNIWEINVAGAEKVIITANMAANTTTNGCVGYSSGDWNQSNWDGTTDSNGDYVYEFEIPDGVSTIQFQVWWPQTVNSVTAVLVKTEATEPTTTAQPTTEAPTPNDTTDGYTRTPGDVNCDLEVSIVDVILLNKTLMGSDSASDQGRLNGDVDGDSSITPSDSLLILKSLVDLVTLA